MKVTSSQHAPAPNYDLGAILAGVAEYEQLDPLARQAGANLANDWARRSAVDVARNFETLALQHGRSVVLAAYGLIVRREALSRHYGRKGGQL